MSDRAITLALAATLALLPLLPTGPQYLGLSSSSWVEAALALLLAIRLLTRDRRPARGAPGAAPTPENALAWALIPFILAVTGAAVLGLAQDNPIASRAFLAQLNEWLHRAFAPINQAGDPLYPARVWLTLVEGPLAFLLVAAICRRAADPARRARAALWGALTGALAVSVFAIVQYFTRFHLHPYWVRANPDLVRSHATFEDPNALGSYLVLGMGLSAAIALGRSTGSSSRWRRGFAAAVGALAAAALITTVSRAAWASAAIAAMLVAAFGPALAAGSASGGAPRYQRWARVLAAVAVVLLLVWVAARAWLPQRPGDRPTGPVQAIASTIDPKAPMSEVLKRREVIWSAAIAMAVKHPITGVGLGRFPRLLSEYSHGAIRRENAHNFYLQILAETGAVGLAAFLLLIAAAGRALRAAGRGGGDRAIVWGLSFGCLAFMLTMLSGHPLLLASMQLTLGTMLAAGLVAAGPARDPARRLSWRRGLVLASSLSVLTYAVALRHTTWNDRGDPWGYSWGLYDVETDPSGQTFRWAGGAADLYSRIPAGAGAALLTFAAFPPTNGATATVRVHAGSVRLDVPCPNGEWHQIRIPLSGAPAAGAGLEIRLEVDRVAVPAADGISQDTRALGVRMQPLVWMGQRSPDR